MEYYTYWTIEDAPNNATQPYSIFFLIFVISLIIFLLLFKFKKDADRKFYLLVSGLFTLFALPAFIYLKFFAGDPNEVRMKKYLSDKKIYQVEGEVSNFERVVPYTRNGRQPFDQFIVDSVKFDYLDNFLYEFSNFGGNHSKVFHNGLRVRITYIRPQNRIEIQKIEFAK